MDIKTKLNISEPLNPNELKEVVSLAKEYPYWHIPMAILARHFRFLGNDKLEMASAMAALRVPNQSDLFEFVYENPVKEVRPAGESEIVEAKEVKETLEKKQATPLEKKENINQEIKKPVSKTKDIRAKKKPIEPNKIQKASPNDVEDINEIAKIASSIKKAKSTQKEEKTESVERTLDEIEQLMNEKASFNLIPEASSNKNTKKTNTSNPAMEAFDTSYDVADHFGLPQDSVVGEGQDFYYWLTHANPESEKTKKHTKTKKATTKGTIKKATSVKKNEKKQIDSDKTEEEKKKSKAQLLDAFIKSNPSISKIDNSAKPDTTDYSQKAGEMPLELATETLARIYEEQGNIKAAKKIYAALMLKFPTKKPYFADRIKKLK